MIELFIRLVLKSLLVRKERLMIAVIAVMLGAAMVTSLLTVSLDIREKMGKELRSYGANLIVLPGEGESIYGFKAEHPSVMVFAPFLDFRADINAEKIEVSGTDMEAVIKMNPWWHIEGTLPREGEVLPGINAARKLGLKTGDILSIRGSSLRASGILDTGTSDDDRIFMHLKTAEQISGKTGATLIKVSAAGDIDSAIRYLESNNYRVKKIRQIAESEKALLDKTQLLIFLVAVSVLAAAYLGLLSTMITGVLERSREIGLMKALGSGNGRIASLFLAEAGVMGAAGGVLGYIAGLILSQFIGMEIFNMQVSVKPEVLLLTLMTSVLVALAGSILPVQRALAIDPVVTLRGE